MDIDKLDLMSPDMVNENFEKLAALFPNCVTEGPEGKAIDFDLLKQELNHAVIEGNKERYRLEWPGKKEAIVTANLPTTKTLRPIREDSVDFDNTENLYVEGDSLEVLKLLQESYLNKIKVIYIDPPYNTGKDFVYIDKFKKDAKISNLESGLIDEEGKKLTGLKDNPATASRYHSDWLTMMYPRLKLARNLLKDNGVLFISIDNHEVENLKKLGKEVFGDGSFLAQFIWRNGRTSASVYTNEHEYILAFAKDIDKVELIKYKGDDEQITERAVKKVGKKNPASEILFEKGKEIRFEGEDQVFDKVFGDSEVIEITNGVLECKNNLMANDVKIKAGWVMKDMIEDWLDGKDVYDSKGQKVLEFFFKSNGVLQYVKERGTIHPKTIIENISTKQGTNEVIDLLGVKAFDYPKPVSLLNFILLITDKDSIILDFFSGSGSTAHSVMKLNSQDQGRRKYIMVQLPERINEDEEAFKAGYENVCEIGKERIRRAGKKIQEELKAKKEGKKTELDFEGDSSKTNYKLDIGFRVYRLDESNIQDVYYKPQDYKQDKLELFEDNVKPDRTADDLLAQVMLDWGLPLSLKIEQANINGKKVFKVAENSLFACFDNGIDESFAKEIAKEKPLRIVFRDNGFKDDTAKVNVKQLLKQLSPETEMKVI